jgi:hypothetical protein
MLWSVSSEVILCPGLCRLQPTISDEAMSRVPPRHSARFCVRPPQGLGSDRASPYPEPRPGLSAINKHRPCSKLGFCPVPKLIQTKSVEVDTGSRISAGSATIDKPYAFQESTFHEIPHPGFPLHSRLRYGARRTFARSRTQIWRSWRLQARKRCRYSRMSHRLPHIGEVKMKISPTWCCGQRGSPAARSSFFPSQVPTGISTLPASS